MFFAPSFPQIFQSRQSYAEVRDEKGNIAAPLTFISHSIHNIEMNKILELFLSIEKNKTTSKMNYICVTHTHIQYTFEITWRNVLSLPRGVYNET